LHFSASASGCVWPKDAECKKINWKYSYWSIDFIFKVKDKLLHHIHQSNVQWVVQVTFLILTIVRYFIIVMVKKNIFNNALSFFYYWNLGSKVRSDSLLCSAGRIWSSREIYTNSSSMKSYEFFFLIGLENCAWPHEVPECKFEFLLLIKIVRFSQVKIHVQQIIPVKCVLLIQLFVHNIANVSMDI
jgi:hypothetical protein